MDVPCPSSTLQHHQEFFICQYSKGQIGVKLSIDQNLIRLFKTFITSPDALVPVLIL